MIWDKKICSHILKLHNYKIAHILALFIPLGSEPDIWLVIRDAWDRRKVVAVPRIEGKELVLKKIIGEKDLETGPYRIRQPKPHQPIVPSSSIQLVFVPGIAFDKKGYRLGFGKGYYDRLMKTIDTAKIGVCYGFQLVDELPQNSRDVKVDGVVTEERYVDSIPGINTT